SAIVWNVATGQPVSTFSEHRGTVGALAFHPDSRSILSAGSEGRVMVWDAITGARTAEYHGHGSDVSAVAIAPTGDWSVTGEWDGTIRAWAWGVDDVRVIDGRGTDLAPVRYLSLDVDPSGRLAVATGQYDNVEVRELHEGTKVVEVWPNRAPTAVFSDTSGFVVGDDTGRLRRYLLSGDVADDIPAYNGPVVALAASPGTGRVASLGKGGRIRLWGVPGLVPLREWSAPDPDVRAIAFDPTGSRMASGGTDGLVRIWSPESGALLDSLACPASTVSQLAFQPGGPRVAAVLAGGAVILFDPARSEPDTLLANGDAGLSLAFSPDGGRLAVGSHDQLIYLFDVARRAPILRLHGHIARVSVVNFLPDRHTLLSASHDGTIRLWNSN
ncbi:MAG TPA: hypothetical protein VF720_14415, partial [Candidatus Eisenbacteria bacterium]